MRVFGLRVLACGVAVAAALVIGAPAQAEAAAATRIEVQEITNSADEYKVRDAWTDNRMWNVHEPQVEPTDNSNDDPSGFEWRSGDAWLPE